MLDIGNQCLKSQFCVFELVICLIVKDFGSLQIWREILVQLQTFHELLDFPLFAYNTLRPAQKLIVPELQHTTPISSQSKAVDDADLTLGDTRAL